MFAEHGISKVLRSDNGPQYTSAQFANFCISWGITHETSSLHYPQSQWICQDMHQVCQTCTPMSQIQQCQSTSRLTSTPSYTNQYQVSIFSRAVSRLTHALKVLRHRLTNVAKHLCHCMLVNQLQCMTPSETFGFLLL